MRLNGAQGLKILISTALAAALTACAPQSVREPARPPELAAQQTVALEPGPPPPVLINPELLWRSAEMLELKKERLRLSREGLQLDSTVASYQDTWHRIRGRLNLPITHRPPTQREIAWFQRNQEYLDRMAERARFYLPYIVAEIERRELPAELALLPIVESAYQPFAYSPAGAAGIWQFIPATGRRFGLKQNWWYDGRRDIVESTRGALDYLQKLNADFGGDWLLSVAAYNWGEGNVRRAIERNRRAGKPTGFWDLRLPRETRTYVPKLLALSAIVADPGRYQLTLRRIDDDPYFAMVYLDSQIDLAHAADLAGITLEEMYLLNPGFNRWATDPDGPHRLLLPAERVEKFEKGLALLPPEQRIAYRRHKVAQGESLLVIARHYRTSVKALQTINGLEDSTIRAGRSLMVPVASRSFQDYKLSSDIRRALARANRMSGDGIKVTYRVRSGDSLWTIARRHDIRVKDLARWNGIPPRRVIRPGQKLVIWKSKPYATPRRAAGITSETSMLYVVKKGDTLSEIAEREGTSVANIAALNGVAANGILRPGQRLRLPGRPGVHMATRASESDTRKIRYTVRAGDSLWRISRRFNVTVKSLQKWNSLPDRGALHPGQTLYVFVAASGKTVKES